MITCNVCGTHFLSVEEFEKHLDKNCLSVSQNENVLELTYQAIYQNGKTEFKKISVALSKLRWIKESSDEFLHKKKSDKDLTEPSFAIF